mmetsp:Transcript_41158/g.81221  ORF Transcript_41158/g.81221 Transcript_41158/m.81221 type:complete len:85 (-) Transcript_41158:649-903(-)
MCKQIMLVKTHLVQTSATEAAPNPYTVALQNPTNANAREHHTKAWLTRGVFRNTFSKNTPGYHTDQPSEASGDDHMDLIPASMQ